MNTYLSLLIFFVAVGFSFCQFPRKCVTEEALWNRQCCPEGNDGSKCNSKSRRGSCQPIDIIPVGNVAEANKLLLDERREWPTVMFDFACECSGNFDGVDCSRCKAGYEDDNCETKSQTTVRRNVLEMTRQETLNLVEIIDRSKHTISKNYVVLATSYDAMLQGQAPEFRDISIYDLFAWMHYYASRNNLKFSEEDLKVLSNDDGNKVLNKDMISELLKSSPQLAIDEDADYAHEGPAFLPWHRYFLLKWEQEIGEFVAKDDKFSVPYWDWTESTDCDVCNNDIMGATTGNNENTISDESIFATWNVVCTQGDDYILAGRQCSGEREGPLLRNPGNFDENLTNGIPTFEEVEASLVFPLYDTPAYDVESDFSFRNVMEGFGDPITGESLDNFSTMHNAVHLFMNGTMSDVGPSANDPVFILHHAFIDSLFERWLQTQNDNLEDIPQDLRQVGNDEIKNGHRLDDFMVPFFPLVRNSEGFSKTLNLGYVYEYLQNDRDDGSGFSASGDEKDEHEIQNKLSKNRKKKYHSEVRNELRKSETVNKNLVKLHTSLLNVPVMSSLLNEKEEKVIVLEDKFSYKSKQNSHMNTVKNSVEHQSASSQLKHSTQRSKETITTMDRSYKEKESRRNKIDIFLLELSPNSNQQDTFFFKVDFMQKIMIYTKSFYRGFRSLPFHHQVLIFLYPFAVVAIILAALFCVICRSRGRKQHKQSNCFNSCCCSNPEEEEYEPLIKKEKKSVI